MPITTLFFDLDDTLYPNQTGLWQAIRDRMGRYMIEKLGMPAELVPEIRREYYQTYGTTLRGLQIHHQVDSDEYLRFVHDLRLEDYIDPDPSLRHLIDQLPQRKFIFTNADVNHARRVMGILGVEDIFDGIIDIRAIEFACKPEPLAYYRALALAGNPAPGDCVMMDDSVDNLATARKIGFTTVLVGRDGTPNDEVTYSIRSIGELPRVMPELWDGRLY